MRTWSCSLFISLCLMGCGSQADMPPDDAPPATERATYDIIVDSSGTSGFHAVLPEGFAYSDPIGFQEDVPSIARHAAAQHRVVRYIIGEHITNELDALYGPDAPAVPSGRTSADWIGQTSQALTATFGRYALSVNGMMGHLDGCIKRTEPHLAARLQRATDGGGKWTLLDLRAAAWLEGDQLCLGVLEKNYNLLDACQCVSKDDLQQAAIDIKSKFEQAFISAGLSYAASWVLSEAAAPFALSVAAL